VVTQPDPEKKSLPNKDDFLGGNKRDKYSCLPHFCPLELEKEAFQAQGGVIG
jgi:hypothetical protein